MPKTAFERLMLVTKPERSRPPNNHKITEIRKGWLN